MTSDVYPISPAKSDRAHRVLGQVVAQFQLRIFQEATEPTPKRQRVVAGLGESAGAVDTENLGRIVAELLLEAGAGAILTEVAAQACLGTTTQKIY